MELIAALLTAFLFWLFLFHCARSAAVRSRQRAGGLLLNLGRSIRRRRWILGLVVAGLLIVAYTAFLFTFDAFHSPLMVFNWAMMVLNFGILPLSLMAHCELHDRGILSLAGMRAMLVPWDRIQYCKWITAPQNLFVQCRWTVYSHKVQPDQVQLATAILTQRVVLRDSRGEVLNPEFKRADDRAEADGPTNWHATESEPFRFQFTLRTLLLLMLVASSAFSWLGIRYQRSKQQSEILAEFQEFKPDVHYRGGYVTFLSFIKSPSKPGDEDLVHLKKLTRLEWLTLWQAPITDAGLEHLKELRHLKSLTLYGARITDAGLVHLEGLTGLENLDLTGTQVTDEGVQRLQRALPDTEILH